jgi:hypothetical protein
LKSDAGSIKSEKSGRSPSMFSVGSKAPTTAGTSVESNLEAQVSNLNLGGGTADALDDDDDTYAGRSRLRIAFITEQISHHPPVSAFYASCPARGIEMSGIDQIYARVSGTTIRVGPGEYNKGIFINLTAKNGESSSSEQYIITHPTAAVNGLLRGSPYVAIGDSTVVTASGGATGEKLKTILEYKEEVGYSTPVRFEILADQ